MLVAAIALVPPDTQPASAGDWLPLPTGEIERIAFGSCAKHWQRQRIWDQVMPAKPDLFLFIGDAIYADIDGRITLDGEVCYANALNRVAD